METQKNKTIKLVNGDIIYEPEIVQELNDRLNLFYEIGWGCESFIEGCSTKKDFLEVLKHQEEALVEIEDKIIIILSSKRSLTYKQNKLNELYKQKFKLKYTLGYAMEVYKDDREDIEKIIGALKQWKK